MLNQYNGVPVSTLMKLAAHIIKNNSTSANFNISKKGKSIRVSRKTIVECLEASAKCMSEGGFAIVRICDSCEHYGRSGKMGSKGWCSSEYNRSKCKDDYCSDWKPMSEQQRHIKEYIDEHFTQGK